MAVIGTSYMIGGAVDPYYNKISAPHQSALIIGTSRAAQGLVPDIIEAEASCLSYDIFNFAFTLTTSPYGASYLSAIKNKIHPETRKSLFILSVDPWSLSTTSSNHDKDVEIDHKSFLTNLDQVNGHPNLPYLWSNLTRGWGYGIVKEIEHLGLSMISEQSINIAGSRSYLHKDGWLEVYSNMNPQYVATNTLRKTASYRDNLGQTEISAYRIEYLKKTMDYLRSYGTVVLIRLPVSQTMIDLEDQLSPEFDKMIAQIATDAEVSFVNLIEYSSQYSYTDGNHLYKTSARQVSEIVGREMNKVLCQ
jgi:hypothetical protein